MQRLKQILKEKLREHIINDYPDLMLRLQGKNQFESYLGQKVMSVLLTAKRMINDGFGESETVENAIEVLTDDLKPSRYQYIVNVLSQEFEKEHESLTNSGLLLFEAVNLVRYCQPVFTSMALSEKTVDDRQIYLAVTGMIKEYFEHN